MKKKIYHKIESKDISMKYEEMNILTLTFYEYLEWCSKESITKRKIIENEKKSN